MLFTPPYQQLTGQDALPHPRKPFVTFSDKLAVAGGRPSGFDLMRLVLAIAVVCQHSMNTTMGLNRTLELLASPLRAPVALILAMFFGLSGFLVTGSLVRSESLISFLGLRVLRLGPALIVEVIFVSLILGPLLTSFPISEYFSDPKFLHYFSNIVGDIQYKLPGVFLDNPLPEIVNQQLWTIPFELKCYIALAFLAISGIAFNRTAFAVVLAVAQLAIVYYIFAYNPDHQSTLRGNLLVVCFLFGVCFYLWRDVIPCNGACALLSAGLCIWLLLTRSGDFLVAGPAVYLTCYLGLANPRKIPMLNSGDYSYGIFLYGFPIQQTVVALLPSWSFWWFNILICVPITIAFAFGSWHLVEKHAQRLRPQLFKLEAEILARIPIVKFWPVRRYSTGPSLKP
jgi:peptidoglycan/LPS O-acetylase OafA/YrhL